jgi:G10 protein
LTTLDDFNFFFYYSCFTDDSATFGFLTRITLLIIVDHIQPPTTTESYNADSIMPPIRSAKNRKPPPDGYDDIEDTLLEFKNKMKDAENAPHDGKKKYEMQWPIFQIVHQRTYVRNVSATY